MMMSFATRCLVIGARLMILPPLLSTCICQQLIAFPPLPCASKSKCCCARLSSLPLLHPPPPLPCRISSVNVPVCLMTFLNCFLLVCPEFKCQYFAPDCRCQCGYRYRLNRVNLWFNRTLLKTLSFQIALNFKRALVAKGHPSSNCPPTSIFSLTSTVFCDDSSQIFEWFDFL